jgi:hypothetical protein
MGTCLFVKPLLSKDSCIFAYLAVVTQQWVYLLQGQDGSLLVIKTCSLIDIDQRFVENILDMEIASSSESLITIYQNTRHHIPDNRNPENKHFIDLQTELLLESFLFLPVIPTRPLGLVSELSLFKIMGNVNSLFALYKRLLTQPMSS